MEELKKIKINKIVSCCGVIFFIIAAFIVSAYYGIESIFSVDFVCTNGDYQNYNVLRRFLAGQVPYKDFANYLGMGVLYMCTPFLSIHNTFAGSLFVTNMMSSFMFIIFTTLVFYIITDNKPISCLVGLVLTKLIYSDYLSEFIPFIGNYIDTNLKLMAFPGNSFRMCRIFLPVLFCLIALIYIKMKSSKSDSLRDLAGTSKGAVSIGLIVGMGLTWSNDLGFCCIGSAIVIMIILAIADKYQRPKDAIAFKRFIYFLPALFTGMLFSILIATRGNITSWIDFTFGVSSWQYTYFGNNSVDKILTFSQLISYPGAKTSIIHFIIFILSMIICLLKLVKGKENNRDILFVFMFVSIMAAQIMYIIGSGPDEYKEGTYCFVLLSGVALMLKALLKVCEKIRLERIVYYGAVVSIVVFTAYMLKQDIIRINSYRVAEFKNRDNYIEQLEGVNIYAHSIERMADIVRGDKLFSVYATALDDVLDIYQPTGNDYIIHALGDKSYRRYVNELSTGDYKWVQTTNTDVWPWEIWTSRASWDVYREIYSDYKLTSNHSMWTLWEYVQKDENVVGCDVNIRIERIDEANVKIVVESNENRPCYVDVEIAWELEKVKHDTGEIVIKNVVMIKDPAMQKKNKDFEGYFLKNSGQGRHIPIYMENGTGYIILSSLPDFATSVELLSAEYVETILAQR